jgi:hypothetical protein
LYASQSTTLALIIQGKTQGAVLWLERTAGRAADATAGIAMARAIESRLEFI